MVGAGHGLWGTSDDYSMPTFAPELAKHHPFRRPRAMVVVWVALHVPVQVLPHDLPTEAHGDPPSRTSVTCRRRCFWTLLLHPRIFILIDFLSVYGAFAGEGLENQFSEPNDNSLTSNGAIPIV